jgi:phage baseplate assembly protein V
MLRFGKICELGTGKNLGFARVNFDDIDIVSGWLSLPSFGTKNIKKWCSIPVNTQVAVNLHNDGEQGLIIDALWSATDTPPTWANANTDGVQFADGTKIYYDNNSHELNIDLVGGTVIFNGGSDGMVKVNSLVTKLNNLENTLNTFMNATFNTHTHIVTAPTLPSATPLPINTAVLTPTIKANLENTKIKQ